MKNCRHYILDLEHWLPVKPERGKSLKDKRNPVTVCIAAICRGLIPSDNQFLVMGAADRMLTSGDIEFEPESPKVVHFTTSVCGMLAGDTILQTAIIRKISPIIQERVIRQPDNWWAVKDVAELYAEHFKEYHLKRAENAILAPLGLTLKTFISEQQKLNTELVKELATKLAQFESPGIEAIICGVDNNGPQIYTINNSATPQCHNVIGFAAIGMGYWHADSQFMFAKHNMNKSFHETLVLLYSAKKHAEVAPGVGQATDMFFIGPGLGVCVSPVDQEILNKLEDVYQENLNQRKKSDEASHVKVGNYFDDLIKKVTQSMPKEQDAKPPPTPPPATSSVEEPDKK